MLDFSFINNEVTKHVAKFFQSNTGLITLRIKLSTLEISSHLDNFANKIRVHQWLMMIHK